MSEELLSICIPTRNRASYLQELLESIYRQVKDYPKIGNKIRIYVSDNASTDLTWDICQKYSVLFSNFEYSRNECNILGDRNILKCCNTGSGKYRWVVGDDELISPNGLFHIIDILETEKPGLFLNNDGEYDSKLKLPSKYRSFRDFAKATIRAGNPHLLIGHTLITANVFLSKCFDSKFAENVLPSTIYAHMYGIVNGLVRENETVYVTDRKTIAIRKQRAPGVDEWTSVGDGENLPSVSDIEKHWSEYIRWLKDLLMLQELKVESAIIRPVDFKEHLKARIKCAIRAMIPDCYIPEIKRLCKRLQD